MKQALGLLLSNMKQTASVDARIAAFCDGFDQDNKHRWVRDLAAEMLHNVDPQ
ncbi:hypothetical protein MNBD_ALPHA06-2269, partial [hydrothermal vent metagenome]